MSVHTARYQRCTRFKNSHCLKATPYFKTSCATSTGSVQRLLPTYLIQPSTLMTNQINYTDNV